MAQADFARAMRGLLESYMDDEKARKIFQAYLDNAEAKSGKTISEMHAALKASGIKGHSELAILPSVNSASALVTPRPSSCVTSGPSSAR